MFRCDSVQMRVNCFYNPIQYLFKSEATSLFTLSCRVSSVPRLAKVVNVLAIRQVELWKAGTTTPGCGIIVLVYVMG